MFLLLLTAREDRVSANHLRCPSSHNPQTRPRSSTARATVLVCLEPLPGGIPNDKTGNVAGILYRH